MQRKHPLHSNRRLSPQHQFATATSGYVALGKCVFQCLATSLPVGRWRAVVTPGFGHAVYSGDDPTPLWPLHATVRIAVVFHPLSGEVSQTRGFLGFGILGRAHLGSLYCHIHLFHLSHHLHPWRRILSVKDQDEAGGEAGVPFLPHIKDLLQTQAIATYGQESLSINEKGGCFFACPRGQNKLYQT